MNSIPEKRVLCKPIKKNERTVYAYSTNCETICEFACSGDRYKRAGGFRGGM